MGLNNLYIDTLTGEEFEEYLLNLFKNLGYEGTITPESNDYGADLVISKNNEKTVVQAKRYSDTVGISAVQEVIGAKNYYKANKCLVVTNNYFTPNAIELAQSNSVELWDRDTLIKMITLSLKSSDHMNFSQRPHQEIVLLKDMLDLDEYKNTNYRLPFVLGRNSLGEPIISSIDKMPHLLIAGVTGAGKSICINTLIISLLYKISPKDVRLVLIDPKVVELNNYNGIPHLLFPVVTDPKKAAGALNWIVQEMIERYKIFADAGVRDLERYNNLQNKKGEETLPQIVIIIDELSNVMVATREEVQDAIQLITQNGRTAGIYLIVTTQVISIASIFKDCFPSKISFLVASQADSRSLLGISGAEMLTSNGDMFYCPVGAHKPIRVQGAYVSEKEAEKVVDFIKKQQIEVEYNEDAIEEIQSVDKQLKGSEHEVDELFSEAIEIVLDAGQASISMLQRRLRIGYARAARIIDEMEIRGIVSGFDGERPRDVLITKEEWDTSYIDPSVAEDIYDENHNDVSSNCKTTKSERQPKSSKAVKVLRIPISFLLLFTIMNLINMKAPTKQISFWVFAILAFVSFKLGFWITNKMFGKRSDKNNYTTKL